MGLLMMSLTQQERSFIGLGPALFFCPSRKGRELFPIPIFQQEWVFNNALKEGKEASLPPFFNSFKPFDSRRDRRKGSKWGFVLFQQTVSFPVLHLKGCFIFTLTSVFVSIWKICRDWNCNWVQDLPMFLAPRGSVFSGQPIFILQQFFKYFSIILTTCVQQHLPEVIKFLLSVCLWRAFPKVSGQFVAALQHQQNDGFKYQRFSSILLLFAQYEITWNLSIEPPHLEYRIENRQ